jgi:hypothetical protein
MPGRIKIGVDQFETLNGIFTDQNEFGPFVKGDQNDLKAVLMLLSKGTEEKSNKVNKEHLFNIIKALLMQLKLAEKVEIEEIQTNANQSDENEDKKDEIENSSEDEKTIEKTTDVKTEKDNKDLNDRVCYFFRTKTCKHGKSGKVPDKNGNQKCSYNHPKAVCIKFKNYGDTDKGCQDNQCKKMHVVHCRHFISGKCDLDKKCKFFHQKNLQKKPQEKKNNQHRGNKSKEKSSENKNKDSIQRAPKDDHSKQESIDFLWQTNPHQMACGRCSCRTNSHCCPQQKQVHQCSQDQIQNNPNQSKEVLSKIMNLIQQNQ